MKIRTATLRIVRTLPLVVCLQSFGQIPDNPQPQHEFNRYSGHYVLGWKQAATGKQFLIPYSSLWLSSIADAEITHAGIAHHVCRELNPLFPAHPSRGELYKEMAIENSVMTTGAFFMRTLGFRFWTYDGPAIYGSVIHLRGASSWLGRCW